MFMVHMLCGQHAGLHILCGQYVPSRSKRTMRLVGWYLSGWCRSATAMPLASCG